MSKLTLITLGLVLFLTYCKSDYSSGSKSYRTSSRTDLNSGLLGSGSGQQQQFDQSRSGSSFSSGTGGGQQLGDQQSSYGSQNDFSSQQRVRPVSQQQDNVLNSGSFGGRQQDQTSYGSQGSSGSNIGSGVQSSFIRPTSQMDQQGQQQSSYGSSFVRPTSTGQFDQQQQQKGYGSSGVSQGYGNSGNQLQDQSSSYGSSSSSSLSGGNSGRGLVSGISSDQQQQQPISSYGSSISSSSRFVRPLMDQQQGYGSSSSNSGRSMSQGFGRQQQQGFGSFQDQQVQPVQPTQADNLCQGRQANDLLVHPETTRKFITCLTDGKGVEQWCPSTLHFNVQSLRCEKRADQITRPCEDNPCVNNGQCTEISATEYRCDCQQGFGGKQCELDTTFCDHEGQQLCNVAQGGICTSFRYQAALKYVCQCPQPTSRMGDQIWAYGNDCQRPIQNPCGQIGSGNVALGYTDKGFIQCDGEQFFIQSCAGGLIWDDTLKTCTWPDLVGQGGNTGSQGTSGSSVGQDLSSSSSSSVMHKQPLKSFDMSSSRSSYSTGSQMQQPLIQNDFSSRSRFIPSQTQQQDNVMSSGVSSGYGQRQQLEQTSYGSQGNSGSVSQGYGQQQQGLNKLQDQTSSGYGSSSLSGVGSNLNSGRSSSMLSSSSMSADQQPTSSYGSGTGGVQQQRDQQQQQQQILPQRSQQQTNTQSSSY